jgi:solute carrier family 25 protein 39/40
MRDVPFSMIYWFNYESLKTLMIRFRKTIHLSNFDTFLCGACAGSIAAFITTPLDVVKTYRQIQLGERDVDKNRRRTFHIIKEIRKTKGVRGLFAGSILSPQQSIQIK